MLKLAIQDDMKAAMKGGDKPRLGVIRLILAAVKQREVDERIELNDEQVFSVLDKMLKQRRDSIAQYDAAGRDDLASIERFEVEVIQAYLPQPLTDEEVTTLIEAALDETGAKGLADMGRVMALLKPQLSGRADVGGVSVRVKGRLAGG